MYLNYQIRDINCRSESFDYVKVKRSISLLSKVTLIYFSGNTREVVCKLHRIFSVIITISLL